MTKFLSFRVFLYKRSQLHLLAFKHTLTLSLTCTHTQNAVIVFVSKEYIHMHMYLYLFLCYYPSFALIKKGNKITTTNTCIHTYTFMPNCIIYVSDYKYHYISTATFSVLRDVCWKMMMLPNVLFAGIFWY